MPPQQPTPQVPIPQPTSPTANYAFIVNSQQQPKRRFPNPLAKLPKILQIAISALIVILIVVGGFVIINGKKNSAPVNSLALLQQQQEITRVSSLAVTDATDQATKDVAETALSTIKSQQVTLQNIYTGSSKKKLSTKVLDAKKDSATDDSLTSAKQNNNYDSVFLKYLKNNLGSYQSALSTAYKGASTKTKPSLAEAYDSNTVLLTSTLLK